MKITRTCIPLYLVTALFLVLSCASTEFSSVSKDDSYGGEPLKKVLVIGVFEQLRYRKIFEDVFSDAFQKRGVEAIQSYRVILSKIDFQEEKVLYEAEKLGVDAILVTHYLGVKEKYIHYDPLNYQHFHYVWEYAGEPVTYTKIESVRLVTNIYDGKGETRLWSAVSETVRPETEKEIVVSLSNAVMRKLRSEKLIAP